MMLMKNKRVMVMAMMMMTTARLMLACQASCWANYRGTRPLPHANDHPDHHQHHHHHHHIMIIIIIIIIIMKVIMMEMAIIMLKKNCWSGCFGGWWIIDDCNGFQMRARHPMKHILIEMQNWSNSIERGFNEREKWEFLVIYLRIKDDKDS